MAKYADVIIDISRGQLDKSFQYRIPAELEELSLIHISEPTRP